MFHKYTCETDLALTYALSRPRLARQCAQAAVDAANDMQRPDLAYEARNLRDMVGR